MGVRLVGINHVAFEVPNLDAALAWYERFFAVRRRGRRPAMAWIDLGDQFIALTQAPGNEPDGTRHVGIVVDDNERLRAALRDAGQAVAPEGSLRVRDPGGNLLKIVDYRDVQFTKAPAVQRGMGLEALRKSAAAQDELRARGLLDR